MSRAIFASADTTAGEALVRLARQVARLGPDRRDPEQFWVDKSDIAAELRRLAQVLDGL